MQLKMFDLMHTFYLLGWVKRFRHFNFADKYNLIELSDLLTFCYDRSDPQDGLECVRERDLYFVVNILSSRHGFS